MLRLKSKIELHPMLVMCMSQAIELFRGRFRSTVSTMLDAVFLVWLQTNRQLPDPLVKFELIKRIHVYQSTKGHIAPTKKNKYLN